MEDLFERIAACVEFGKINQVSPYPPAMKGQPGAEELTVQALEENVSPSDILTKGLILGMERIGLKFKENKVFVPQVLMSAKAMGTAMKHLKPFFNDGTVQRKGQFIIGTVEGDLHDIGKNLVAMMIEGNGYEVIDLGVDVKVDQYLEAIRQHPNAYVGMSALLTTEHGSDQRSDQEGVPECDHICGWCSGDSRLRETDWCGLLYRRSAGTGRYIE